ncbi:MAG: DEAD/DEAH box helicase [Rhabdochlamydiaceae bacterium]|nr:DEAD/DEAH box helicase [Candidatus Amphrikana amoebophyrae]
MTFENLDLDPQIIKAINDAGYTTPSPIQLKAIPVVLSGSDLRASAQTGTGKTAAFLLPSLNKLATPSKVNGKGPRILILVPTRELAMQVTTQANKYSKYLDRVKTVCIVGGVPYPAQTRQLSKHYDVLIATPGRLIDFIERKKIDFSRLEVMILDEADRMLDMGFLEPVEQIIEATPPTRQTLLFSATLRGSVIKLSNRLLNNPVEIVIQAEKENHDNIEQKLHYVDDVKHKNRLLEHILSEEGIDHSIIFTATKRHAAKLVDELRETGYKASALHGDMNQRQRTRTIAQYREGKFKILVATDVAARGIDVKSITHVINFDLPHDEDYVHRIGRTGRAGAKGKALSFVSNKDAHLIHNIESYIGKKIEVSEIEGLEPKKKIKPASPGKRKSNSNTSGKSERNSSRRFGSRRPKSASGDDRRRSDRNDGGDKRDRNDGDQRRSNSNRFDDKPRERRSFGDNRRSEGGNNHRRSEGNGERRDSRRSDGGNNDRRRSESGDERRSEGNRKGPKRFGSPKRSQNNKSRPSQRRRPGR